MFGAFLYEVIILAYIALYRKYRPTTFDNILGQENVTKILKNQIKQKKISHAYLFSGTRGTGKTSAAKVFARAINCLNPKDGEPCNECEVCKSILEGNTSDVVEMDAASNNSVENIRQIRQEVAYATIDVKYRVYIIDEVHMLTTSAFNALLKTLEEPPENVVFILATTEQHKIPVTILSRCLRFEFNRISTEYIIERLKYVLEKENIAYDEDALEYIAKLADGGMRDALSILDRCISEMKDKLNVQDIQKIVGTIDKEIISNITDAIINYDGVKANENIDLVIKKGKDLRQLVYELDEEFLDRLIKEKDNNQRKRFSTIIDRLSKLDSDLRQSPRPAIVLKSAIIELCMPVNITEDENVGSSSVDANLLNTINMLSSKISSLESELSNIKSGMSKVNIRAVNEKRENKESVLAKPKEGITSQVSKEEKKMNNLPDIAISKFNEIDEFKKKIVEHGKLKLYSALAGANIYISEEFVLVITNNSFAYNILKSNENLDILANLLASDYGINKNIRVELKEEHEDDISKIEKLFEENNVNYTEID